MLFLLSIKLFLWICVVFLCVVIILFADKYLDGYDDSDRSCCCCGGVGCGASGCCTHTHTTLINIHIPMKNICMQNIEKSRERDTYSYIGMK